MCAQELHASIKGRAVQQEGLFAKLSKLMASHLQRHSAANEATQATTTHLLTRLTEAANSVTAVTQGLASDGHQCLQVCFLLSLDYLLSFLARGCKRAPLEGCLLPGQLPWAQAMSARETWQACERLALLKRGLCTVHFRFT